MQFPHAQLYIYNTQRAALHMTRGKSAQTRDWPGITSGRTPKGSSAVSGRSDDGRARLPAEIWMSTVKQKMSAMSWSRACILTFKRPGLSRACMTTWTGGWVSERGKPTSGDGTGQVHRGGDVGKTRPARALEPACAASAVCCNAAQRASYSYTRHEQQRASSPAPVSFASRMPWK